MVRSLTVLFLAAVLGSGCAARGAGGSAAGGGGAFSGGVLTTHYDKDVVATYAATVNALTDLGMTIRRSSKEEHLASILATRPDDMAPVEINLRSQNGVRGERRISMCERRSPSVMLLLLIVCSGCSALSRAGYGDRGTFNEGMLTTRFDQDVGITYAVAIKALDDLDVTIVNAAKEESRASIEATRPADKAPVVIAFIWQRHDTTGATVKVGENGDETYSRTIVDAIEQRLSEWQREYDLNSTQPGRPATEPRS
jgi:hypothetical protein